MSAYPGQYETGTTDRAARQRPSHVANPALSLTERVNCSLASWEELVERDRRRYGNEGWFIALELQLKHREVSE